MKSPFDDLFLTELPDAAIVTNPERQVVPWSKADEDIFGYTSEEALERLLDELVKSPASIPVVAVTAYLDKFAKRQALQVGCDAYLLKPISTRTLSNQLDEVARR